MFEDWLYSSLVCYLLCIPVTYAVGNEGKCIAAKNRVKVMGGVMAKTKPDYWTRLNENPVCINPRYDTPGRIKGQYDGFVGAIKLVHIYGKITCNKLKNHYENYWGCDKDLMKPLGIFITDRHRQIIFNRTGSDPPGNVKLPWYSSGLFDGASTELVFNRMADPLYVNQNTELSVWYGEDLINKGEDNNDGETCVDVYVHFV